MRHNYRGWLLAFSGMGRESFFKTAPERTAVIVDAVRTPIGRAHAEKGWFRETRGDDLAVAVVRALLERTGIDPATVDDCIMRRLGPHFVRLSVAILAGVGSDEFVSRRMRKWLDIKPA